jgi:ABC-type transport system involved in multi-copper enzyme maturation permease subunit
MMGRVWGIALNTFREAIRNKVLYGVIAAVVGVCLFGLVLGSMSLNEGERIARDIGLAGVSLFGSVTAIVLGVSLLYTEIQKRTIHVVLANPIQRHEFVLGKYTGMALTLTLLTLAFGAAMLGIVVTTAGVEGVSSAIGKALLLGWLEVLVVAAVAIFFSSFSTPYLSGLFTFAVFFIGRVTPDLAYAAERAKEEWIKVVAAIALRVVPDLHLFAVSGTEVAGKGVSVHGGFVGWDYVAWSAAHGVAWIGLLLVAAMLVFSRRDFT